ncbi:amino acid ABC transporter permease [Methylocapsa sp. S129]|uniref:amino acid ABC transporter permease n=1 Tax=Methylocapsa sp. S129 TaxID=1641869 RepID=UPI00131DDDE4|nr:amino acid ABC transporter permease [Methylocapsa sp. S129]
MTQTVEQSRPSFFNDPRIRGYAYQALLVAALVALVWTAAYNAYVNMEARGIPMGFGFWDQTAGFDISQKLIPYSSLSTYGQAFWVGLLNTALVGALGVLLATPLGFAIGVARLSPNWILARIAQVYVEIMRNTPLLLQLLFWYNAVLKALPGPRQSITLTSLVFLNNRGLYVPKPVFGPGSQWLALALALGIVGAFAYRLWARRRQALTGAQAPVGIIAAAFCLGLPAIAYFAAGRPVEFDLAQLVGFNLRGGVQVSPELAALAFGLITYTAGFIAEIVRSGVLAVSSGQSEAASALGLRSGLTMKLVVIPQAMRLITPPLTSQYLSLVKNSSLAVFIGYPDLVQVFAGTVLNQTQAAVQVMAITMGVYLVISLAVALALNVTNARHALKER